MYRLHFSKLVKVLRYHNLPIMLCTGEVFEFSRPIDKKQGALFRQLIKGKKILTPRQKELLRLAADGYSTEEIANKLSIEKHTVNLTFANIYDRLNAKDRTHAVAIAIRENLI
jgi:DNA-binding NarL/FixJ family response regulator